MSEVISISFSDNPSAINRVAQACLRLWTAVSALHVHLQSGRSDVIEPTHESGRYGETTGEEHLAMRGGLAADRGTRLGLCRPRGEAGRSVPHALALAIRSLSCPQSMSSRQSVATSLARKPRSRTTSRWRGHECLSNNRCPILPIGAAHLPTGPAGSRSNHDPWPPDGFSQRGEHHPCSAP